MANLLGPDNATLVGSPSWLTANENNDASTEPAQNSEAPGPSRRPSNSRRNRGNSSENSSDNLSPMEEFQRLMLNARRFIYQASFSDFSANQVHQTVILNNPFAHAHPRRQNQPVVDPNAHPPLPAPDFDVSVFVPRHEYENGRMLLMRNERAIPSLSRLVAASQIISSTSASANSGQQNLPSNSEFVMESVFP